MPSPTLPAASYSAKLRQPLLGESTAVSDLVVSRQWDTSRASVEPEAAEGEGVLYPGRFGRFTTEAGGFHDPAIPQLSRSHFTEVWTLQVASEVYFQDYAPMVWQALPRHLPDTS